MIHSKKEKSEYKVTKERTNLCENNHREEKREEGEKENREQTEKNPKDEQRENHVQGPIGIENNAIMQPGTERGGE